MMYTINFSLGMRKTWHLAIELARRENASYVSLMNFFTAMVNLQANTSLLGILMRLPLDLNKLEEACRMRHINTEISKLRVSDFSSDMKEVLAIARRLAKKRRDAINKTLNTVKERKQNTLCVGVPQFFEACILYNNGDNEVMQELERHGFSIIQIVRRAIASVVQ